MDVISILEEVAPSLLRAGDAIRQSLFIRTLIFLIGIYVVVLFVDLVFLLALRGFGGDIRETFRGMNIKKPPKGKMYKRWGAILNRLETDSESQYKVAVIEADKLAEEILGASGYEGKNMKEKMERIIPGQLENLDELSRVHEIRNRIVYEKDFSIDRKTAKDALEVYEEFLRELEFF